MAANRFATLIHRKTNRITLVLVYAFLEWSLIFFILLNSLFSYFILRFADYFGLKRPCLFCSRLDRFFDASGKSPSHRDLLCDDHALEISRGRSKPLESKGFGESRFSDDQFRKDFVDRSCCVEKTASSGCAPIEPDLGIPIGDETQIRNCLQLPNERSRSIFVLEEENAGSVHLIDSQEETEEKLNEQREEEENTVIEIVPQSPGKIEEDEEVNDDEEFSCYVSSFDCNKQVTREKEEENKVDLAMEVEASHQTDDDDDVDDVDDDVDKPVESTPPKNLEFYIDDKDCHLIPVEFYKPSEEVREISDVNGDFILDFGAEPDFAAEDGGLFSDEVISAFASPDKSKPTNLGTLFLICH